MSDPNWLIVVLHRQVMTFALTAGALPAFPDVACPETASKLR